MFLLRRLQWCRPSPHHPQCLQLPLQLQSTRWLDRFQTSLLDILEFHIIFDILMVKEVPKLPPPIWLEEIQSNAIFNKQRHKLLLEKQSHVEKEVDLKKSENHPIRRGKNSNCMGTIFYLTFMHWIYFVKEGRDDLEDHSLKENSKTESDQEAEEAEDLC